MTGSQKTIVGVFAAGIIVLTAWLTRDKWWPAGSGKEKGGPLADCNSRYLFVGDSLTAFNPSFIDQFKQQVCPGMTYKKIAKVGSKTDWMDAEIVKELALNKYDVVVIWGGINDIYSRNSITDTKVRLQSMYDRAHATGAKVIAITIPPTKTYSNSTSKTASLTNELNAWIRSNKSIDRVIDANKLLNNGSDGTKQEYLQPDTLHINSTGHREIMEDFQQNVSK